MVNDTGIRDLYAAIFNAAIEEDTVDVRKMIHKELENKYNENDCARILSKHDSEIEGKIKRYIWEESVNWPGTRKIDTLRNKQKIVHGITKPYIARKWFEEARIRELSSLQKSWHRMAHFFMLEW